MCLLFNTLSMLNCSVVSDSLQRQGLQDSLSLHHLPEFAQVHVHCISDAVQPSHPLTPSSPSALNLSQHQGLFQWVVCSHQMTRILELQHQSFQWIFRVDLSYNWLVWSPCWARDFQESSLAPQFEGINSLAFCPLYGPALTAIHDHWEKTVALTRRTFVGKVMSLLRLVITFLPRSKCLLISWLQSPSARILEPRKIKSATVSTVSPSISHEVIGLDAMISFLKVEL